MYESGDDLTILGRLTIARKLSELVFLHDQLLA